MREPERARFLSFASAIIDDAIKKEKSHSLSYIKLDGAGVSGISNLSPSSFPEVYEMHSRDAQMTVGDYTGHLAKDFMFDGASGQMRAIISTVGREGVIQNE